MNNLGHTHTPFLLLLLLFGDSVSLCILDWPRADYVDKPDLKLIYLCPRGLGSKVHTSNPASSHFEDLFLFCVCLSVCVCHRCVSVCVYAAHMCLSLCVYAADVVAPLKPGVRFPRAGVPDSCEPPGMGTENPNQGSFRNSGSSYLLVLF